MKSSIFINNEICNFIEQQKEKRARKIMNKKRVSKKDISELEQSCFNVSKVFEEMIKQAEGEKSNKGEKYLLYEQNENIKQGFYEVLSVENLEKKIAYYNGSNFYQITSEQQEYIENGVRFEDINAQLINVKYYRKYITIPMFNLFFNK